MANQLPGTWREPHREVPFDPHEARTLWKEEAILKLESVASTYGAYITYQDLGSHLFETTQVRTTNFLPRWIRHPLYDVLDYCDEHGLPAITALVVQKSFGMVGPGFSAWLRLKNQGPTDNDVEREVAAAQERLASYRLFCPDVPENAVPMPTPHLAKRVNAGTVEWPWAAPTCSNCGRPLRFNELCPACD